MSSAQCKTRLFVGLASAILTACGGSGGGGDGGAAPQTPDIRPLIDVQLDQLIGALELDGDPTAGRNLPSIEDPMAQLGKKLFFSKSLSGDMDTACASCHHPALGGSNGLSLPVGAGAEEPDVLGIGRHHPDDVYVPRNAPTTFNVGLYDGGLLFDSRIESIGKTAGANGAATGIRTPDTPLGVADPNAGDTLPAAQARFPVVVPEEMLGNTFEAGADHSRIREHLAARIGNYGIGAGELGPNTWLEEFQTAFASALPADQLITFDNIMLVIGEYVRSQVFVDTPWLAYVEGDEDAISQAAKRGALQFFRNPPEGAGCMRCHTGDFFTDELHHNIAFPQVGPGKGDGDLDDFGRARETDLDFDRYHFRTPSLLNVEVTGPYSHSGAYTSLERTVDHYRDPERNVEDYFAAGGLCQVPQFEGEADCPDNFPSDATNTMAAIEKWRMHLMMTGHPHANMPDVRDTFTPEEVADVTAFLGALTDPCVKSRACLAPWIPEPDEDPDGNQLNAVDADGIKL